MTPPTEAPLAMRRTPYFVLDTTTSHGLQILPCGPPPGQRAAMGALVDLVNLRHVSPVEPCSSDHTWTRMNPPVYSRPALARRFRDAVGFIHSRA